MSYCLAPCLLPRPTLSSSVDLGPLAVARSAILNKTKNWGVIFVSSACVKFATVDLNGESTYVVVDDMLHLLGYAENSLRKGLMAVQQEVKEVKQELKEVKQEFKEVKQEVKQVKQDVGLLKSLISIVSNVLFWLVAFVFYIKKRLVGDIGALQANVEATAAKVEEASKQQDQKNKALVQLSTNAAKKAMAATSAADAAAHGIEVMGQRLNRNAAADLKRFGKQKAQIDNLNTIVNK